MAETHCNGSTEKKFKIPEIKFTKLFINGAFVDAVSGLPFPPFSSFFLQSFGIDNPYQDSLLFTSVWMRRRKGKKKNKRGRKEDASSLHPNS